MTSGSSSIDYEALQSDAMRGVVRAVLTRTAKSGLPGDHHFYISFDTTVPGVGLSKRLKEKYPAEMTIVLQHRFWDLIVSEERFEVKLTFDGIPERLVVPFAALKVFFDPSVRYGLQFEEAEFTTRTQSAASNGHDDDQAQPSSRTPPKKPRTSRKSKTDREIAGNAAAENIAEVPRAGATAASKSTKSAAPVHSETPAALAEADAARTDAASGAQILSLDQFRKK